MTKRVDETVRWSLQHITRADEIGTRGFCRVVVTTWQGRELLSGERIVYEGHEDSARLIAAAPDLLEACKELVQALTTYRLRDVKKRFDLCCADAAVNKAIFKATKE